MSRNRSVQKKKRFVTNMPRPQISVPAEEWSRGDILAVIGLVIAIIAILFSLTTPELRRTLGLDPPAIPGDPPPYPHLLTYYDGYEQVIPDQEKMDIRLIIWWQSPVENPEGDFEGYIIFSPDEWQRCNISGSLNSTENSTFTRISFNCAFPDSTEYKFKGYIYPDGHISGTITKLSDSLFVAHWYFFVPNDPGDVPAPQANEYSRHTDCPVS